DRITVQFIMTNVYPHGAAADAGVHYYIVKESQLGQKNVPGLGQGVVIEGTFTFALKPQARVGTRQHFTIRQPGNYLLRVESQRTQRDHEHFSAINFQIEGEVHQRRLPYLDASRGSPWRSSCLAPRCDA